MIELPEGLSALAAIAVVVASFFTSLLTAAFGLGGGIALLAIMGVLLPSAAIVPVHGVAQLGANLSRFAILREHTRWDIIKWFSLGCLVGALIGAFVFVVLPEGLLRLGVGAFVLWSLWAPQPTGFTPKAASFFATGAVGSFLTMFFGATGPIAAAMLSATRLNRLQIVSTHAASMVVQHGVKTAAFLSIGFAYQEWIMVIGAIIFAGAVGAWVGTRLLKRMDDAAFKYGFRLLLSSLAIYLIILGLIEFIRTD